MTGLDRKAITGAIKSSKMSATAKKQAAVAIAAGLQGLYPRFQEDDFARECGIKVAKKAKAEVTVAA